MSDGNGGVCLLGGLVMGTGLVTVARDLCAEWCNDLDLRDLVQ